MEESIKESQEKFKGERIGTNPKIRLRSKVIPREVLEKNSGEIVGELEEFQEKFLKDTSG